MFVPFISWEDWLKLSTRRQYELYEEAIMALEQRGEENGKTTILP